MNKRPGWFIRADQETDVRSRLFLFPHAGGNPNQYKEWGKHIGDGVAVYIAFLPGRGMRFREKPISDLALLISTLAEEIQPLLSSNNFFLGHSLGALIAYQLAKRLSTNGVLPLRKLIVSARNAPHVKRVSKSLQNLSDAEFILALQDYGATPLELLAHKELMALQLPMLRADFSMAEQFVSSEITALDCGILALGAKDDRFTDHEGLEQWSKCTKAEFNLTMFEGGHFYFQERQELFFSRLREEIRRSLAED
ncbi:MAG TPA: alpha/beta fold hydrolase [Burkholderiales bacterium]|jgi:surfactin synthase thioesterase subunit|nr:alpha/beta fold hydrolase [Burkholderiales bacterium]